MTIRPIGSNAISRDRCTLADGYDDTTNQYLLKTCGNHVNIEAPVLAFINFVINECHRDRIAVFA
jgi:hypothetical protein